MTPNNDELDIDTIKLLLVGTRERLFEVLLANIELEAALKIERERVKTLIEDKKSK